MRGAFPIETNVRAKGSSASKTPHLRKKGFKKTAESSTRTQKKGHKTVIARQETPQEMAEKNRNDGRKKSLKKKVPPEKKGNTMIVKMK